MYCFVNDTAPESSPLHRTSFASGSVNSGPPPIEDVTINASEIVISKNNNTTYIKLNDGNALSMSKFDVSGTKLQKGIKGG